MNHKALQDALVSWLLELALNLRDYSQGLCLVDDVAAGLRHAAEHQVNRCYGQSFDKRNWTPLIVAVWARLPNEFKEGFIAHVARMITVYRERASAALTVSRLLLGPAVLLAAQVANKNAVSFFVDLSSSLVTERRRSNRSCRGPMLRQQQKLIRLFKETLPQKREALRNAIAELVMNNLATPETASVLFVEVHSMIDGMLKPIAAELDQMMAKFQEAQDSLDDAVIQWLDAQAEVQRLSHSRVAHFARSATNLKAEATSQH